MDNNCAESIYSNDYLDYIVEYFGNVEYIRNTYSPECIQLIDNRLASIYLPNKDHHMFYLENPSIGVHIPYIYGLMDNSALIDIRVPQVRLQPGLQLYGSRQILGIIDTGIDYRHEAFIAADGTSRILSIWDQTNPSSPPENFHYGTEYTREQINAALASPNPEEIVPEKDEIGHGTFMAGVACGNTNEANAFSGVAPLADIVAVKLKPAKENLKQYYMMGTDAPCYQENDIMAGIRYLLDKAQRAGRAIVILIGVGTNLGDHNGSGPLGEMINDNSLRRGAAFVCPGGNELNRGHHFRENALAVNGQMDVEVKVAPEEKGFTIQLWSKQANIFSVGVFSPSGEYSGKIPARAGQSQVINYLLEGTTVYISYQLVTSGLGTEMIMLRFLSPREGNWRIRVYNDSSIPGGFDMWLPIEGFLQNETAFLLPDPEITICEPANNSNVITNATYNDLTGSLYVYSSRGFTSQGGIKPDITAPGVGITGPYPGIRQNNYTEMSGSCVGASFVAGVTLLLFEWALSRGNDLNVNSRTAVNYLIRGARRTEEGTYPSPAWGWGILDAYGIFENLRPIG